MGVTKEVLSKGNGADRPKKGDEVTIEYTGNLYDESAGAGNNFRGKQYAHFPPCLENSKADQRLSI